jgi:L-iduronidase
VADPALPWGGPCTQSRPTIAKIFDALLDHCDTGQNYFTGETGVRIDFISFHVKDLPQTMIERELRIFEHLKARHPKFAHKPLINDESDPIRAWATPFWWQEGPWYAAYVVQSIDLHQRLVIDGAGANYRLFSSDHAFMGDWNQRTTHTLFRDQPNPDGFVLIKKPVLTVMEMVAKLGRNYVGVEIPKEISAYFGVIPSQDGDVLSLLIYNKTAIAIGPDPRMTPGAEQKPGADMSIPPKPIPDVEVALMAQQQVKTQLRIRGIKGSTAILKEFLIDETHGNPHHEWAEMGKPKILSPAQLAQLKLAEQPALVRSQRIECLNGEYLYSLVASSPSVCLITIVPEKSLKP